MARPVIPEKDLIKALRSNGGAMAAVAQLFEISPRTLRRRLDKMDAVSLKPEPSAEQQKNCQIESKIIQKALAGDVRCCILYLKHVGWGREVVEPVLRNKHSRK